VWQERTRYGDAPCTTSRAGRYPKSASPEFGICWDIELSLRDRLRIELRAIRRTGGRNPGHQT
jgi:hypothetical protein